MALISPAALLLDEVARAGSIRKAAERLNVSASALNRRILNLEQDYGVQLFERLPRGMRLTAAGEVLIADIRRWRAEQERSKVRLQELQGLRRGHVAVGLMECLASGFARRLFGTVQDQYRRVTLEMAIGGTPQLMQRVADSELDIAVCFNAPDRPNLRKILTLRVPAGVVVAPDHPLAGRATIRLSDCIGQPFLMPDFSLATRHMIDHALTAAALNIVPSLVTNSTTLMKTLLRDGRHVAFLSAVDVIEELAEGSLCFVPVTDRHFPPEELSLIGRVSQGASPPVLAVTDLIRAQMTTLKALIPPG